TPASLGRFRSDDQRARLSVMTAAPGAASHPSLSWRLAIAKYVTGHRAERTGATRRSTCLPSMQAGISLLLRGRAQRRSVLPQNDHQHAPRRRRRLGAMRTVTGAESEMGSE